MYELAKNPRNVFIIGGSVNSTNTLSNAPAATLEEALLKIRNEKMKGRGTAAYVQMKDEDNQLKIKGFVNVLGEIYSCGSQGEGAFFNGLCENPGSVESKVYLGNYIVATRTNEDYFINANGSFGKSKQALPITPTAMAAGAWTIYQLYKPEEKRAKPENVLNAFPKVSLFSLLVWCPVFLLYWLLKFTTDINIFGWLGREFDTTITQILFFFLIWTIISSLYVDSLRRKKGFMLFNDAINNLVGTAGLSKIIMILSAIGTILSVLVFYPFSYSAFFVSTFIAFSANMMLNYGGKRTWFINTQDPVHIPLFTGYESGTKVRIEYEYETSQGLNGTQTLEIRSNGNSTSYDTIEAAVLDPQSKSLVDYLENCVHITSIVKSYNPLSEAMMLAALGSLKSKPVSQVNNKYFGPSEILLQKEVSQSDRLIFTLSLFKEAAHELIYSENNQYFAFRTPNNKTDSPFIFENERKNFYHFAFSEKNNAFELQEPQDTNEQNWIKL
jgi:hypothetical protein